MQKTEEAPAPADELEKLFPAAREVQVGAKTVKVEALGIRKLGQVARLLKKIADAAGDEPTVIDVFVEHHDELIAIVATATGEADDWVGRIPPADFVKLVFAVVEVNADFFVRGLPELNANVQATMRALGVGPTSSITSNPAAT